MASSIRVSKLGDLVLVPPQLPGYLSAVHELKPIMGMPAERDVKAIHATIRSLNALVQIPTLYNHDLSVQLSQHLFAVQMGMHLCVAENVPLYQSKSDLAVYRANYSTALLPGDNSVFTPPVLPAHIPGTLNTVVGLPSQDDIKLAHSAVQTLESLANVPHLYDTDLSINLSQHMFNLQFARYMHNSSSGRFVIGSQTEENSLTIAQTNSKAEDVTISDKASSSQGNMQVDASTLKAEQTAEKTSELAKLGEILVTAIKDVSSESMDILRNMDRILTSMKNDQSTAGCMSGHYHVFKNPTNRDGVLASERGLPHLRYWYYNQTGKFAVWLEDIYIIRYLKFFGIGAHLIQGGETPTLLDGKRDEAEKLLLTQVGLPC